MSESSRVGDNSDPDIDGDGVENDADEFPFDPDRTEDGPGGEGPGSPDVDSDGDGVNDAFDPYPHQNNTQCFP